MYERPNYYLLLDLDPAIEDENTIAKKIQEKRLEWSKKLIMGNPAHAAEAKANIARISDIQRVMSDPEERRKEIGEEQKQKKEDRRVALDELDQMIKLLRVTGGLCTTSDIGQLVRALRGNLSESEIRDRVVTAGLSIEEKEGAAAAKQSCAVKPRLDPARMDQLRPNLTLLGVKNLYDFLGMSPRSSTRSLREHADQRNRELLRSGKNDLQTNSAKALCGLCMIIFDSDENKQKYDNSLTFETMEWMRPLIELAGGRNNFLSIEHENELVRQARERGIEASDAREFLEAVARRRKWTLEHWVKFSSGNLKQCANCGSLANSSNAKYCSECGRSLADKPRND